MLKRTMLGVCVLMLAMVAAGQAQETGTIMYEIWDGIGGTDIPSLIGSDDFPNNPTSAALLTLFETPTNRADNFGGSVYGWLHPEVSGDYTFWIAADDNAELWLSTTDSPDDAVLIASEDSWAGPRGWAEGNEKSVPISLVAGEKYFIEALYKEGGGGDNLAVGWAMSADVADIAVIEGKYLSPGPWVNDALKLAFMSAQIVSPADGAVDLGLDIVLEWTPGPLAVSTKVYLSTDATIDETDLLVDTTDVNAPLILEMGTAYYARVDAVNADEVIEGAVISFTTIPEEAHLEYPADGGLWQIGIDTELSWVTGLGALVHNVYFSADKALVDARDPSVGTQYWAMETFDPGTLEMGTAYYWAVDEFSGLATVAGPTWSFDAFAFPPIAISDPDLLIHYGFEAGEGEMVNDLSGHENFGFFRGAPQWTDGIYGGGLGIDIATLDYVETGTPLGITTNTVTVTGWVKHDAAPAAWSGILTHRGSGNLGLQHDGTELRHMWGADQYWDFSSGLVIPNGEWYFAALAVTPDQATLYLNGVENTATNVAEYVPVLFDSQIRVGRDHTDGRIMTSTIDDVRFYNRTLSDTEILWVMSDLADITGPDDVVVGIPNDGDWPGGETPNLAIDNNTGTKFLHFKGETEASGIQIAPAVGGTVVVGLTLTTANDSAPRDPASFELYGSNESIDGPYDLIASGDVADFSQEAEWPRFTKNATTIAFENEVAYTYYQVMFPTVRDAGNANSMQIAEIELIGSVASLFAEDFEAYAAGSDLHGVNNWEGWEGTAGAGAPVSSAQAYRGSNSVEIIGTADLVKVLDFTGGQITLTAMQYIPSGTTGDTFFILMNQYAPNPLDWSPQSKFSLGSGQVNDGQATIVYDQWVELKYVIDLDNNTVDEYYNGEVIRSGEWDNDGHNTLQAIDLYSAGASSVYYDNIVIN
jgi:hypothetical protein